METPCRQRFQDKWVILYIFGKARLRAIVWLPLEPISMHLAPSIGKNVFKMQKNRTIPP